ncbi:MAG: hypothetical protein ACYTFY_23270, partial [Planctomycetota bacterium]
AASFTEKTPAGDMAVKVTVKKSMKWRINHKVKLPDSIKAGKTVYDKLTFQAKGKINGQVTFLAVLFDKRILTKKFDVDSENWQEVVISGEDLDPSGKTPNLAQVQLIGFVGHGAGEAVIGPVLLQSQKK